MLIIPVTAITRIAAIVTKIVTIVVNTAVILGKTAVILARAEAMSIHSGTMRVRPQARRDNSEAITLKLKTRLAKIIGVAGKSEAMQSAGGSGQRMSTCSGTRLGSGIRVRGRRNRSSGRYFHSPSIQSEVAPNTALKPSP